MANNPFLEWLFGAPAPATPPETEPRVTSADFYGPQVGAPPGATPDLIQNLATAGAVGQEREQRLGAARHIQRAGESAFGGWDPQDIIDQYYGTIATPEIGSWYQNPFVQKTISSVGASLDDPEVIDPTTAARLKAEATATILGTAKAGERQFQGEMARRGVSDAGLSSALRRQAEQQTGGQISGAERDVEIQRALMRRQSELAAQQTAAALTGTLGRQMLGEAELGASTRLGELAAGRGAAGIELAGKVAALTPEIQAAMVEAGAPTFLPDILGERDWNWMNEKYEEMQAADTQEARDRIMAEIIGAFGQILINVGGPALFG